MVFKAPSGIGHLALVNGFTFHRVLRGSGLWRQEITIGEPAVSYSFPRGKTNCLTHVNRGMKGFPIGRVVVGGSRGGGRSLCAVCSPGEGRGEIRIY